MVVRIGASFTNTRVIARGTSARLNGLRPAQTPQLVFTSAIGWESRGHAIELQLRRIGPQFEDDLNQRRLPPAVVIDGFLAWPLAPHL